MTQQPDDSTPQKQKGGVPYRIEHRTKHKQEDKPLSGYAVDITIRVNSGEAYFLEDHNSKRTAMPHNNREELVDTIRRELRRNHIEHFGHA